MDEKSMDGGIWFADEEICRKWHQRERWLAVQKRIAKRTNDRKRGYFTVKMLSVLSAVGCAVKGIDPGSNDPSAAEAEWVARKRRPGMSEEERARRRQRAIAHGFKAKDKGLQNSGGEKVSEAM